MFCEALFSTSIFQVRSDGWVISKYGSIHPSVNSALPYGCQSVGMAAPASCAVQDRSRRVRKVRKVFMGEKKLRLGRGYRDYFL